MTRLLSTILYLTVASGACTSADSRSASAQIYSGAQDVSPVSNYRKIAIQHLGEGVECLVNEAKTMVLCTKTEAAGRAPMVNNVRFVVIALTTEQIIHQEQVANGKVEWHTPTQLKISTLPETARVTGQAQQHEYIFDLETKQKLTPGVQKF